MGFQNKQGEHGDVVRNKARLVTQDYGQVKGLDFGKTFAPIAHLEAIRILLSFAASKGFKLYQLYVKSDLLNGVTQEKVFVRQPLILRTPTILIECTSFQRLCTGLSNCHGHGMLGLKISC
jgi:hypothetical protein